MTHEININAIAYEEGGAWVIQGIEYDIVASAADFRSLPKAFMRAVMDNACITEYLGRKPLEGIEPAPAHFRELFDQATWEMRAVKKSPE
jgi:hypothetical protein